MPWELMTATLAITAGAAVYVAWPLLTGRTEEEEYLGGDDFEPVLEQLLFKRDATYTAIKELEFDRAAGKLSEEDFAQAQERYRRRALLVLKRIDQAKTGRLSARYTMEDFEDEAYDLEETARSGADNHGARAAEVDLDVEEEIEAYRRKSRSQAPAREAASRCPSCGHVIKDKQAAFCSRCGASVAPRVGSRPPGKGRSR